MKIKPNFMLRVVSDNYIVVPVGSATKQFNGMITLNETSAFLWNALTHPSTKLELVEKLMKEYDVTKEVAERDVDDFITKLKSVNVIEE